MKTSNKLLIGFFLLFTAIMIVGNVRLRNKLQDIKANPQKYYKADTIQGSDSIQKSKIKIVTTIGADSVVVNK